MAVSEDENLFTAAADRAALADVLPLDVPLPMAVVELSSGRLLAGNAAFAALLGVEPSAVNGLDVISIVGPDEQPVAKAILAGVAAGTVDSCRGRGSLRRAGGEQDLPVVGWIGRLGSGPSGDLALLALAPAEQFTTGVPIPPEPPGGRMILGTVDHDWRFDRIGGDVADMLGWGADCRGLPLLELVHPDDTLHLLLALGRSSAGRGSAAAQVRVRGREGTWPMVRCDISPLCSHNPPRFAVAIRPAATDPDLAASVERALHLEAVLSRVVHEARAAGIGRLPSPGEGGAALPPPSRAEQQGHRGHGAITPREIQLLGLAAAGLSNRAIAERLTLSVNTVRTQFQRVLTKLGAHSKLEAVAIARSRGLLSDG